MICKWCNKEIEKKFYLHVNGNHHKNLKIYFKEFPDQKEEYDNSKPKHAWNKGFTKEDNESVAKYAKKIKEHKNKENVRLEQSNRLKKRYEKGDILSPEKRAKVVKSGSDAWVKKIKNATSEQKREMLHCFTSAGRVAQKEQRPFLTPDDYNRMYKKTLKGTAEWHNCDNCGKRFITVNGGNVKSLAASRPKKRFCDRQCYTNYLTKHPTYGLGGKKIDFYSNKMNKNMKLMGCIEIAMAEILEESKIVEKWEASPFFIEYFYDGKKRKYYPDFLINDKIVLEVKSRYVFGLDSGKTAAKLASAYKWCVEHEFLFEYWEFNKSNKEKIKNDIRVREFLLGRN